MNLCFSEILDNRIEEIAQSLMKTNSEYALAVSKSKELYNNIESILYSEKNIRISLSDCMDFKEILEHECTSKEIMRKEFYKQGYIDCVKLLKMIGVLV